MKKIFISIPWFHPAFKAGGPVQSIANMVAELSEGYRFYIFCGNTDLHGLPINITVTNEWVRYNAYTQVWYAGRSERSQHLTAQVEQLKPDCLYIIGLFDWHFNLVPLFFAQAARKILSVRGMLHPGALGEKALKKKVFFKAMQWLGFQKKCSFHATDALESEHIRQRLGAEVTLYEAGNFARNIGVLQLPVKEPGQLRLVSIALISPMKNILLVLEALEQTAATVLYDIYGPVKEMGYWESCLEQIRRLPGNVTVRYHKEVSPMEVPEKLMHAQVCILPSKSENFGHAIYEALSAGMPVITSKHTPWNGLEDAVAGINSETSVEALRLAIEFFAQMDNETFLKWNNGAAAYAERNMDVRGLKEAYGRMFSDV